MRYRVYLSGMKKLISMTDFALEQGKNDVNSDLFYFLCSNYAQFLKQRLTLGMFVPCDEDGNVLEEPSSIGVGNDFYLERVEEQYQQAKERVLFEGFYIEFNAVMSPSGGYLDVGSLKHKTIETIVGASLTLTPSALKQIGL